MAHPDGLLTTADAAKLTGRSHTTISKWARDGCLPYAERKDSYGRVAYLFRPLDLVRVMIDKEATCLRMNHRTNNEPEETYEELCRLVEERLRPENLPKWWWKEVPDSHGIRLVKTQTHSDAMRLRTRKKMEGE